MGNAVSLVFSLKNHEDSISIFACQFDRGVTTIPGKCVKNHVEMIKNRVQTSPQKTSSSEKPKECGEKKW